MADNQQSRFEKSLGLLTTKFVTLLQKAKDGILDLKVVSANMLIEWRLFDLYYQTTIVSAIHLLIRMHLYFLIKCFIYN